MDEAYRTSYILLVQLGYAVNEVGQVKRSNQKLSNHVEDIKTLLIFMGGAHCWTYLLQHLWTRCSNWPSSGFSLRFIMLVDIVLAATRISNSEAWIESCCSLPELWKVKLIHIKIKAQGLGRIIYSSKRSRMGCHTFFEEANNKSYQHELKKNWEAKDIAQKKRIYTNLPVSILKILNF